MAGLTMCSSAFADEAAKTSSSGRTVGQANVMTEEIAKPGTNLDGQMMVGGAGENEAGNGVRANPCTLGATNCYDRPAGVAPYIYNLLGQFNTQIFLHADNFIASANDDVTTVCWNGWWAPDSLVCDPPANPPGTFTLKFYADGGGLGLPGALINTYVEGTNLNVTQGETGVALGFNTGLTEVGFSATLGAPTMSVTGGTCYWVEFSWGAEPFPSPLAGCFFELAQSYEQAEGDRASVRRDSSTGNPYDDSDRINRDITMCVGFANALTTLVNSNVAACWNTPRVAPANDDVANAVVLTCGPLIDFKNVDNTYAGNMAGFACPSCKVAVLDPACYVDKDVWFKFTTPAAVTSAYITTCSSPLLGGLAPGDSIIQVYSSAIANPTVAADLTQLAGGLGCNDNACSGGQSSIVAFSGLTQNTNYWIRLTSVSSATAGKYKIGILCPVIVPATDLCSGAAAIPTSGGGTTIYSPAGYNTPESVTAICALEGEFPGCGPGLGNTAKSIWYKLTQTSGAGQVVQLSTDEPLATLSPYDTRLSVFLSCDGTCNPAQMYCVAADDDIDATNNNFASQLTFCANSGSVYYIMLHGFGSSAGPAIINARVVRDDLNNIVACCDNQPCPGPACTFLVPCGADSEDNTSQDYHTGVVSGQPHPNAEPCNVANTVATNNNNAVNFNSGTDGTSAGGAGQPNLNWGRIVEGVAMKGYAWSFGAVRDNDWFIYSGVGNNEDSPVMLELTSQHQGPQEYFFIQARGCNYWTGSALGGLGQLSGAAPTGICGQTRNFRYAFSHLNNGLTLARNANNTTPGNELGWRIRNSASGGEGYPCGTNSEYWIRIDWALPTATCTAVADPGGTFDNETNMQGFDGTAGAEPCANAGSSSDYFDGCDHPLSAGGVQDKYFMKYQSGVPITGRLSGTIGAGASRDIEQGKINIPARSVVRMNIDSAGPTSIFLTSDDCTVNATTYGVAATRGACYPGLVDVDDVFILEAGDYQIALGSGDAFGTFNGIFVGISGCLNPIMKWVARVDVTAADSCSVTCTGAVTEVETACEEFGTECTTDNDGCAESVYLATASTLTVGGGAKNLSGTLFATFDPPPLGSATFTADVDYWGFTVPAGQGARITFNIISNGPVYGLIADVGAGGVNCLDTVNGVRVLGSVNATSCSGGSPVSRTCYLEPGTYAIVVAPGTVETGTNGANLGNNVDDCTSATSYCISANVVAVGRCCTASDCTITSQADCTGTWNGSLGCSSGYSIGALDAGCSGFSSIASGPNQLTNFLDEEVRQVAIPAFKFYGTSYTQLGVGSNGYVEFIPSGGASTGSGTRARLFPNAALPNGIAAPFWRDWEPNAPGAAVYLQTSGGVTTVEWNNVATFNNWNKRATFQIVLTHATGAIEYRYGTFTGLACEDLTRLSVGAEGGSGLNGANYAVGAPFLAGNHCLKLTPAADPCAAPVCCQGNADHITPGGVNFADITSVLANFGGPGPNGDADCNNGVNFADITSVLANFGSVCP